MRPSASCPAAHGVVAPPSVPTPSSSRPLLTAWSVAAITARVASAAVATLSTSGPIDSCETAVASALRTVQHSRTCEARCRSETPSNPHSSATRAASRRSSHRPPNGSNRGPPARRPTVPSGSGASPTRHHREQFMSPGELNGAWSTGEPIDTTTTRQSGPAPIYRLYATTVADAPRRPLLELTPLARRPGRRTATTLARARTGPPGPQVPSSSGDPRPGLAPSSSWTPDLGAEYRGAPKARRSSPVASRPC